MAHVIPDTLDFEAYLRQTDPAVKVRPAKLFREGLEQRFGEQRANVTRAQMHSTKLRGHISFRPGEVTVWAGYNGHRKSMLTGQVALDLMRCGERVLMASFEMDPADTLARQARQWAAQARPSVDVLRRFSDWTDGKLWIFDHIGRIKPDVCMAVVRYFAQELRGTHVFIDSMMMVCESEESLDEQKQFMTDVVRSAQELGIHVHLVAHCRKPQGDGEKRSPTKYDLRGSAAISDQAHNVVTVWANKEKAETLQRLPNDDDALNSPDALVSVEKQRNGSFEGKVRMWFDPSSLRFCDSRTERVEPYWEAA